MGRRDRQCAVLLVPLIFLAVAARAADEPLHPGDVLGPDTAARAEGLLPPEILRHYEKSEYRNPVVAYPPDGDHYEQAFLDATARNVGTLDVNDAGTVVDKATGQQPRYVYGIPFPHIDPADPHAGIKVVWNQFYSTWNHGNLFNVARVIMLNRGGIDRDIYADGYFKFYDGQAERFRDENPGNLQSQFFGVVRSPADLHGTASLTWRYRDSHRRDSVWAYVPALRRVRAVSPTDRSDGYLGSDISADDGFFFDGKPEDFTWELVGHRDALRLVDPNAIGGEVRAEPARGGGWTTLTKEVAHMAGFEEPGWRGVPWAPVSGALAKRPMWVVRATPKDRYYLYGKVELWIDEITWSGAWSRKFTWQGDLVQGFESLASVNQPVGPADDRQWIGVSTQVWACAENYKLDRATLGGMRPYPNAPFVARLPLSRDIFNPDALVRYGK